MAITQTHAQSYLGKPVVCQCRDGRRHVGVVHRVTNDGIYLQQGTGLASAEGKEAAFTHADQAGDLQAEAVFWPLLFLPFFTLAALSPWFGPWGYGYGYRGYGRYWL
ncbi:hypothetical protein OS242_07700 [Tumebacillus sp. DT12]|uniref:Uncharacterized protein n=1 Tax=Tumebacillus lacus TaxID=2995335 RepID=A0ABT3X2P7_9BACL|nr:hypothetical protein [Tumebacillus lacus]MCX7569845.1 hypothetical protein [Tumebacillus lacus]